MRYKKRVRYISDGKCELSRSEPDYTYGPTNITLGEKCTGRTPTPEKELLGRGKKDQKRKEVEEEMGEDPPSLIISLWLGRGLKVKR